MIHNLTQYMFTMNKLNSFFLKDVPLKKQITTTKKKVASTNLLIPKFDDTLFWCYYIMKYGLSKYMMVHHCFKEEQKEKIHLVSIIRENKTKMKKGKFKRIKTENDVLYEKKMSIQTFVCLCYINDLNVLIADDRKYIEINPNEQKEITVIKKCNEQYGICNNSEIKMIREKYWKVNAFSKPLKRLSYYKAKDLREICKKLDIPIHNEKQKIFTMKKLYNLISQKI